MPGRSRKQRRREVGEDKKATKASKVGTWIKYIKCKQIGHNSRTCESQTKGKRKILEGAREVLDLDYLSKSLRQDSTIEDSQASTQDSQKPSVNKMASKMASVKKSSSQKK